MAACVWLFRLDDRQLVSNVVFAPSCKCQVIQITSGTSCRQCTLNWGLCLPLSHTIMHSSAVNHDIGEVMTSGQVIRWWEVRRVVYNAVLLVIGVATVFGTLWLIDKVNPDSDIGTPMLGILLYAFMANLCYTMGWIIELLGRQRDPVAARLLGQRIFRVGMVFSCLMTSLPFWFACAYFVGHKS